MKSFIYGKNAVLEAIKDSSASEVVICSDQRPDRKLSSIIEQANIHNIKISYKDNSEFKNLLKKSKIDTNANHQKVLAYIEIDKKLYYSIKEFLSDKNPPTPYLFVLLDSITDPHNFGAILRSCDVFGVTAVVYPKDRSASLNPTTFKTSSGAANNIDLICVTNLNRAIEELKENDVWIYGTIVKGGQYIYDVDMKGNVAVVLGSEEKGLRQNIIKACDFSITIPNLGKIDSLNVSVANGVILYEIIRQRKN